MKIFFFAVFVIFIPVVSFGVEPAAIRNLRSVKLKKPPKAIKAQPPQIQLVKGFK